MRVYKKEKDVFVKHKDKQSYKEAFFYQNKERSKDKIYLISKICNPLNATERSKLIGKSMKELIDELIKVKDKESEKKQKAALKEGYNNRYYEEYNRENLCSTGCQRGGW